MKNRISHWVCAQNLCIAHNKFAQIVSNFHDIADRIRTVRKSPAFQPIFQFFQIANVHLFRSTLWLNQTAKKLLSARFSWETAIVHFSKKPDQTKSRDIE